MSVYGGLKRLREWNDASVHVVTPATDVNNVSPTFIAWADSLHVSITTLDRQLERLPLWHGNVLIHGSEVS